MKVYFDHDSVNLSRIGLLPTGEVACAVRNLEDGGVYFPDSYCELTLIGRSPEASD